LVLLGRLIQLHEKAFDFKRYDDAASSQRDAIGDFT
jgi:hypothetical protein